jgi:hypothetical protein
MALAGKGVVVIWNGIRDELREDFFEWHPREHMVERLGIAGFIRGRRCIAQDGATEFLTIYELRDTNVLLSEEYKTRLTNPTPWSTKTLPGFTDNTRGACQIDYSDGHAMGGFILTLRFAAKEGQGDTLVQALKAELLPMLTPMPRITGAHLVHNDVALTGGNAGNQRGRVIHLPELIVMVEALDARALQGLSETVLSDAKLQTLGAKPEVVRGLYQLEYSIANLAN